MKRTLGFIGTALVATVLLGLSAAPASATTFCVSNDTHPGEFFPACPDNGTNQAFAALEETLEVNGNDGNQDKVIIEAGTVSDSTFNPDFVAATDPVEVVGAGRDQTRITSTSSANTYVLDFSLIPNRPVTMHDLRIVVPESFPNGVPPAQFGHAMLSFDIDMDRVDFESLNPGHPLEIPYGSSGLTIQGDTSINDVKFFGSDGGGFGTALAAQSASSGDAIEISRTEVEDSQNGFSIGGVLPLDSITIDRSHFNVIDVALEVERGAHPVLQNSIIEAGATVAIQLHTSGSQDAELTVRNSTIVNTAVAQAAFYGKVDDIPAATGDINIDVTDSIIRGFSYTWGVETPSGNPARGDMNLDLRYSNFLVNGLQFGDAVINTSDHNIDQDPLFAGATDYHLAVGSPSIDAGDPAPGGLLEDFDAQLRPLDGDSNGSKVRDQGAYEFEAELTEPTCDTDPTLCPPNTCENTPSLCPVDDKIAPKITKVRFKSPKGKKKGSLRLKLSEKAKITATFKPVPKGKGKKKRKTVKLKKSGKAGSNSLVIKKGKLKTGKYKLSLIARDSAGNRSNVVKRTLRVKG